jgi:hypothetical protein
MITSALSFGLGIAPGIVAGWLLLRGAEGRSPVLGRLERLAYATLLGPGVAMLAAFTGAVTVGLPLSRWGFALAHVVVLIIGSALWWLRARGTPLPPRLPLPGSSRLMTIVIVLLGAWTLIKSLFPGAVFLLLTPVYLDDTLDNWNLRAKVFAQAQAFIVDLPRVAPEALGTSVSSYPPLVPLFKAWLVAVHGQWSDALVNAPHLLWFFAALVIVGCAVARRGGWRWGLLATYVLGSLPLFVMHGTNAYADAFLAAHVAAIVLPTFFALQEDDAARRGSWWRIGAMMTGILLFTKNEAAVLYLPPHLAVTACALVWMRLKRGMSNVELRNAVLSYGVAFVLLGLPWLVYKWLNGFTFGNAKELSSLALEWHDGVLTAIAINTLFEGNWILLFPLLFLLMLLRWKDAFRTPLLALSAFFLMTYILQLAVFIFTPLAWEAIRQTGYARGLIQLAPIAVVLTVLLAREWWGRGRTEKTFQ